MAELFWWTTSLIRPPMMAPIRLMWSFARIAASLRESSVTNAASSIRSDAKAEYRLGVLRALAARRIRACRAEMSRVRPPGIADGAGHERNLPNQDGFTLVKWFWYTGPLAP